MEAFLRALDTNGRPETPTLAIPTPKAQSERSIVVLPFAHLSADPDDAYFCDGLTEDLISALTRVPTLKVVARSTAFSFKGSSLSAEEIGRKLAVANVLEGSVRKAGEQLRITARLSDVANG